MTVRTALRQRLLDQVASLGGRVFEPSTASPSTEYPFLVLSGGAEDSGLVWSNVAQPFELWPYVAPVTERGTPTPYGTLDQLVAAVQQAFGGRDGYWFTEDGIPYVAAWTGGAGEDFPDEGWQGAITRPQRVEVASLAWLLLEHAVLDALRSWTTSTFPGWVTDPNGTPPSDAHPWVFWRFATLPVPGEALTLELDWLVATVEAHVVAPSPAARMTAAAQLARALGRAGADRPAVQLADGSWLQIAAIRGNPDTEPRTQGQVQVDVRYLGSDYVPLPSWGVGPPFGRAILYGPPTRVSRGQPVLEGGQPAATGGVSRQ